MARLGCALCLLALAAAASGASVSPVQKVVELLESCKAKVQNDLATEAKAMEEYSAFCDKELEEKGYAIKTAVREINDLSADIQDSEATVSEMEDVIAETGTLIAGKDKEMYEATTARTAANEQFVASEKEMIGSVDELARAAEAIKGGASAAFLQAGKLPPKVSGMINALKTIVEAENLDIAGRKRLQSFLQAAQASEEDSEDLELAAPKAAAFESASGGILETVEDMQKKAEDSLSGLRQKEMKDAQSHELIKQNLNNEITNAKDKLSSSTKAKAAAEEALGKASSETVETKKSKAADEQYSASLKSECEMTATAWAERQKSATEEMGAIDKAKEILVSGVKVLVQVKASTRRADWGQDDQVASAEDATRTRVVNLLRSLARKNRNFVLAQLASASAADPFGKVRGLINDILAKLQKEAEEEATHEAFCQEETAKSKASKEEKTMTLEKHANRIEEAEAAIAELTNKIKTLEGEIAEIDGSQKEATRVRTEENAEYKKASADFRDSAEAVARAIEVLKGYYEGAFLVQVKRQSHRSEAPTFGSARGDAGSSIISILEMSQEDFTTLLAECEENEATAAADYEKLTQENKVSRASKEASAKAAASNLKSTKVGLENYKEDHASVSAELDAVLEYIDKLKPECESKAMSYAERKAAREAEIEGLKQALGILDGSAV